MSALNLARPELRNLRPYEAAVQVDGTVRLNANEMPAARNTEQFRRPLNRYPEVRPALLRSLLAKRYGCPSDKLLVTRGSSEAIDLLLRVFCRAGIDNVVATSPSFSMYAHYALVQGALLREVATHADDNFAVRSETLLSACDDETRIIFLCSPNNPTGTIVSRETLVEILAARRGKSIVVADEAYIEFAEQNSAVELLSEFDNLVVLRTLSKALAFAGVRCGVAIAATDTIRLLDAVQAPYALSTPVIECIEDALRPAWLAESRRQIETIVNERQRLAAALGRSAIVSRVYPSEANFILVRMANIEAVLQQLDKDRILLRHFGSTLADCVRITVGSRRENEQLLASLQTLSERSS